MHFGYHQGKRLPHGRRARLDNCRACCGAISSTFGSSPDGRTSEQRRDAERAKHDAENVYADIEPRIREHCPHAATLVFEKAKDQHRGGNDGNDGDEGG